MTFKPFKASVVLLLLTSTVFAQKTEKKFNEKFYTNNDVVLDINASNAEIEVTTWDKNEVEVEGSIQIEGLDKKEAEKYLNSWNLETLGNKAKVQIKANQGNSFTFGDDNVLFFNSSSNSNFPQVYRFLSDSKEGSGLVEMTQEHFEIPEIEIPEIEIPEIDIDYENMLVGLEDITFDFDKYAKDGDTYFFEWKDGVNNIKIKSKKEWEKFKKTKEYKKFKKEQEQQRKELNKRVEELKKAREEHVAARVEHRKELLKKKQLQREALIEQRKALIIARQELKKIKSKEIEEAFKKIKELNGKKSSTAMIFNSDNNDLIVNGKKVTITKKITIKVPKKATFNLNTRHCKIKLPDTKANGKVSYGFFKAGSLKGGELNVSYSPVSITSLNACTLFLNNVTDAKLASVTNTRVDAKSSKVEISNVYSDAQIVNSFGDLEIVKIHPDFNTIKIVLNYANAIVDGSEIDKKMVYTIENKSPLYPNKPAMEFALNGKEKKINGSFNLASKDQKIEIEGKFTQLTIK